MLGERYPSAMNVFSHMKNYHNSEKKKKKSLSHKNYIILSGLAADQYQRYRYIDHLCPTPHRTAPNSTSVSVVQMLLEL